MILDANGKPIKAKEKSRPILGAVAMPERFDRYSTHPSERLSPQKLGAIFREAETGNIYRQMKLFEEIEEKDTHLFSQMQTRKNAVAGLDWSVLPASDDPKDKKAAEFIGNILYNFENMDDVILDLLDAIGKGFSACEIMWGYKGGYVVPRDITWRHAKKMCFDDFDNMRILTKENRTEGIPIPPNKFIIHKYKARSGSPTRAGIFRIAAWMYLFKNYSLKDWLAFSEVYGMPIRLGRYEPGTSQEDKDALITAVQSIGADAAGVISKDTEIQFIESVRTEGLLYDRFIKLCNAEMSKAILGQTLTTEASTTGSYALGKTQGLVRQDLLEADSKALQKTLRRDLIRPLIEFNLGSGYAVPWIKFNYESPEDLVQSSQVYRTLVVDMHLPVSKEHIYEKFGIPMPEENQAILEIPTGTSSMGFPFKKEKKENIVAAKNVIKDADGQDATDDLSDNTLKTATNVIEKTLDPLLMVIKEATSLENLREKLLEKFKELEDGDLEDLLQKAIFIADLNGRASVMTDEE